MNVAERVAELEAEVAALRAVQAEDRRWIKELEASTTRAQDDAAAALTRTPANARAAAEYARGVEDAAKVAETYQRDASFDDSQVGAGEHNANQANIAAAIRALSPSPSPADGWRTMDSAPQKEPILLLLGETVPHTPDVRVGVFIDQPSAAELGYDDVEADGGWLIWNTESDFYVIAFGYALRWAKLPPPPAAEEGR
ncbi:MAG: hypothetical protein Q7S17_10480 [Xanthobacteraceae bacterium]|nr:hypothetical protein [Xanthobacteraceae bacterium]